MNEPAHPEKEQQGTLPTPQGRKIVSYTRALAGLRANDGPPACFYTACKVRIVFTLFKWFEKKMLCDL